MFTARLKANNDGTSLVEVLVGIAILVTVSVSLFALFDFTLRVLWENKARIGAQVIANQHIELAHNLAYTDVGTVGGIPAGTIEPVQNIVMNDIDYTVTTAVIYIDDPFDGTLGGSPDDLLPADYKRVRVEIAWPFRLSSDPVVFLSDIAPNGIESDVGGGTLRITVLDASGVPVPQANVHIENSTLVPVVNTDLLTNSNGQVILPGAPAAVESYEITVTKSGYSTDQTYSVDPVNLPTPIKPHLTVAESTVTDSTFAIDLVSTINAFVFLNQLSTPEWWDQNYQTRRRITVTNDSSSTISNGYAVKYDFDHGDQVALGKSLASGDDVRLMWWNGSSQVWQELDRVNTTSWNSSDPTEIWFSLKNAIPAGNSSNDYFIYYNNLSASPPLNDPQSVFLFYDDFEDPDYTYANWTTSTAAWVVTGGEYHQSSSATEEIAYVGPNQDDILIQADVRLPTSSFDAGIIGRYDDSNNYYIGRPTELPVLVDGSVNNDDYVLGQRALVQATDGTLAVFVAFPDSDEYKMYTSTDGGHTWAQPWTLSTSGSQYGTSAWLDSATDTIYFAYTDYAPVSDEYRLQLNVFTYNSGSQTWSTGAAKTLVLADFDHRPYRPSVIYNGGTLYVSYAQLDSNDFHEIAVRTSTDDGDTWSSATWLSDWNTFYNDQTERRSLQGELVSYNGDIVAILNGAHLFGWRSFNGTSWSAYEELVTNSFHNRALSTTVSGASPSQELHVFYRDAGDSGRPHEHVYDGSSWSDEVVSTLTSDYALTGSYADAESRLVVYFGSPQDDSTDALYVTGKTGGAWELAERVYGDTIPLRSIAAPATSTLDGLIHTAFVAGANNTRQLFAHGLGTVGSPGASTPLVSVKSSGTLSPLTPAYVSTTAGQSYRVTMLFFDDYIVSFADDVLVFGGYDSSVNRGQLGLYANNTEAYYDNVIMRNFVRPEPTTSGDLEEEYDSSDPIAGVPVLVRGSKLIGWDLVGEPVYKYSQEHTSDSDGTFTVSSVEWDAYDFIVSDAVTTYDVIGIDPPDPVAVNPNTTQQVNIYLQADADETLRVRVLDVNNNPLELASVRVQRTSAYDETLNTTSYGQAFFTPLSSHTYDVTVDKTGYIQGTDSIAVTGSSTLSIILVETGGGPPPGSPPLAPTLGSFTSVAETSMTLNWTDNATDEDGYKIYRNTTASKPVNEIATLGANSELYPATGLTCNTTYYWWVEAYNASGENDDSGSQATLSCPTLPDAPTFAAFNDITDVSMTLNWIDNASNEDGYRVYRDTVNTKPGSAIATLSANTQTYPATGLVCDTDPYYWWVEAYNAQGDADDTSSQATLACPAGVTFSDTFTEGSNTELSLHTPDLGSGWTQIIEIVDSGSSTLRVRSSADQLRRNSCRDNEGALYRTNSLVGSDDYEVRVTQINGDTGNDYNFLAARIVDASNMYAFKWNESNGQLYKRELGTWTTLGAQVSGSGSNLDDGSTITLKVDGTTISVIDDGNTLVSVTDSTFASAGYAGVGMGALVDSDDDCSGQRLDNYEVEEF